MPWAYRRQRGGLGQTAIYPKSASGRKRAAGWGIDQVRREPFDRQKVLKGLILACKKRPVPMSELEEIANAVEAKLHESPGREIESSIIGNMIVERLHALDDVAYVRFASVYRDFSDITELKVEVDELFGKHSK